MSWDHSAFVLAMFISIDTDGEYICVFLITITSLSHMYAIIIPMVQRKPYEHFADHQSVRLIVADDHTNIHTLKIANSLLGYKYAGEIKWIVSWAVHVQDCFLLCKHL